MFNPMKPDIPLRIFKLTDGIRAVRILAAIDAAARQKRGQLGNGDTIELLMEDVVQTLLQIGNLVRQPADQALCNLAEEDTAFAGRVYQDLIFDTNRKSRLRHISAEKGLK